jgi:hypothetical protein
MDRRAAAAALLLLAGCLAPQDIYEAEPDDEDVNHAPRIVADQALVEGLAVSRLHVQTSCDRIVFRVGEVEEFDLEDTLELRFFLDYDRGCPGCTEIQEKVVLPPSSSEIRTTGFDYTLRLPLDEGLHLVEAWVSDGFSSDRTAEPVNRAVAEGKGFDKVVWVIEVEAGEGECLPVAY